MILTIAAANYPVTYHRDIESWQAHTEQWVRRATLQGAQLLLFPEYGSMELVSLFSEAIQRDIRGQVQEMNRLCPAFCDFFGELARRYSVWLVAPSMPVLEAGKVYNRCFVFNPNGDRSYQDKYFMTRFELEDWGVEAVPPRLYLFETDWGRFGVQICYDVEFALGAALLCAHGAELILAPSCTETIRGSARVHTGARARALEQQCYTVVSPLVGDAPWSPTVDINYGYAAVYSTPDKLFPEEGILAAATPQEAGWLVHSVDMRLLKEIREDGQTLNFKDHRSLDFSRLGPPFSVEKVSF